VEDVEELDAHVHRDIAQPGDVPSGSCQALDEAGTDGVPSRAHDNGDRVRRFLRRPHGSCAGCDDDIDPSLHQLLRQGVKAPDVAFNEPQLYREIAALDVTELLHGRQERAENRVRIE
jgi:hypothetical protein